jgi:Protein of unknown function (DUF3352)
MKARPFLAALLAAAFALFSSGVLAWWLLWQRGPLALQHQPLELPLAARFVPRSASLSLHWLLAPGQPAAYARAVAQPRQRRLAAAAMERLRDGAFAAAGLDYASELSSWLGRETSLALISPAEDGLPPGWVLALRSRDSDGARRFLQRFWQSRSLAGTELQITSYRGMGLISGRGALLGQEPQPLATALINDDLVLIASGRGVLEQALDVSQIDELNQAASPALHQAVERLGQGVALLTARPEAMGRWLGFVDTGSAQELVAVLQPRGRDLQLDAVLQLREPLPALSPGDGARLLEAMRGPAASLALISRPAQLLAVAEPLVPAAEGEEAPAALPANPWRSLLAPVLEPLLAQVGGPLPALLAADDDGPLLWAQQSDGWLLGTSTTTPALETVQEALEAQGYSDSPLDSRGQALRVWTRLRARPAKGNPDQLQAELAGARAVEDGWAWWGQGLGPLHQQHEARRAPTERLEQLQLLATPQAPFQWAMEASLARRLLDTWRPWGLLNTLASTPLTPVVEGAALSLEPEPGQPRSLHLRGRVGLGA